MSSCEQRSRSWRLDTEDAMNWFHRLCRESGLMIHEIVKPLRTSKREVNRTVKEKKVSDKVTLRRTTIDEIEIKQESGVRGQESGKDN
jgi:hypothetical protein